MKRDQTAGSSVGYSRVSFSASGRLAKKGE